MTADRAVRVAILCDVDRAARTGRLARCLALAEELVSRGHEPVFVCDSGSSAWAEAQLRAHGLRVEPAVGSADEHLALLERLDADAVVLDRGAGCADDVRAAVRRTGRPTLAFVDTGAGADLRAAQADVLVDPSNGAEERRVRVPDGSVLLAGLDYRLMRNDVLANRPIAPPVRRPVEVPRVVGVFDGDEHEAARVVAEVLAATGRPFDARFFAPGARVREEVAGVRLAPRQRVEVAEPGWRLHERVSRADAVLTTASPWAYESLCLGSAVGLVWAEEEHVEDYRRLMVRRVVVGLGSVANLRDDSEPAAPKAARLLSDPHERGRLAEAGWNLVDALGRARVADALLALARRS